MAIFESCALCVFAFDLAQHRPDAGLEREKLADLSKLSSEFLVNNMLVAKMMMMMMMKMHLASSSALATAPAAYAEAAVAARCGAALFLSSKSDCAPPASRKQAGRAQAARDAQEPYLSSLKGGGGDGARGGCAGDQRTKAKAFVAAARFLRASLRGLCAGARASGSRSVRAAIGFDDCRFELAAAGSVRRATCRHRVG